MKLGRLFRGAAPRRCPDCFDVFDAEERRAFDLPDTELAKIPSEPRRRVMDLYLRSVDLQRDLPYALLPGKQRPFVQWPTTTGKAEFGLSEADILEFLHTTAEHVPEMLLRTWLINRKWQQKFPFAVVRDAQASFIAWLGRNFAECDSITRVRSLPRLLSPTEESLHIAAVKSEAPPAPTHGINLLSHFCYPSGIQRHAFNVARGFESVQWKVSRRDVPIAPQVDTLDRSGLLGLELYPVTFINIAPQPFFREAYERSGLLRRGGVRRIAYWAWELPEIPAEWTELEPLIDEIWATSAFVADAFRSRFKLPVRDVPPPVALGQVERIARSSLGIPEEHYVFGFAFDIASEIERKNPLALIRAFRAAFPKGDGVTLLIKTSRGSTAPAALARMRAAAGDAQVVFVDALVSYEQALGYIALCDCFVSLHRAEGFGLCLAEAMLMGKPVIATNYSGNLAFMHPGNSLLVDYKLIETAAGSANYPSGYQWAEPSFDHAVAHLRYCYENRAAAVTLGQRAQAEVMQLISPAAAGERLVKELARA